MKKKAVLQPILHAPEPDLARLCCLLAACYCAALCVVFALGTAIRRTIGR